MAEQKTWHYSIGSGWARCGVHISRPTSVLALTRNQSKVTCRNCLREMGIKVPGPKFGRMTPKQKLQVHITGLEAKIASLTDDIDVMNRAVIDAETNAENWRRHAEHIQSLAAEGKDPLTGEEPEFWLVYGHGVGDSTIMMRMNSSEDARTEARRWAESSVGRPFYVLPAFDYYIAEVSPVTWKRKSREKAENDEEVPF